MEWKIGEIKQVNGELYQCIEGTGCYQCAFNRDENTCIADNPHCTCRSDKKEVVFKKLEKAGDPFTIVGKLYQHYKVFDIDNVCGDGFWCVHNYKAKTLTIEIKQNKQDMEEKDIKPYDKIFSEGTVSNTENLVTSSLKPFDLEAAKAGKPVCTRNGHKARIICFDYNGETGDYPIVALVHYNKGSKCYERVLKYTSDGLFNKYGDCQHNDDLMMLPEKRSGWAKIRKDVNLYNTKEEADRKMIGNDEYVTAKVCWEE